MDEQALNANLIRRVNLGDTLTRTAWRLPQHEAVVEGERRLTYAELNAEVNRLANALAGRGYGRGDPILLVAGNCLEFLQTYYACAKLGAVCVPINLLWGPAEVAYVVEHCGARAAIVEPQFAPLLGGAALEVFQTPLDGLTAGAPDSEPVAYVEDRDPLSYLYTSGTTSAPKGVVGSHTAIYIESLTAACEVGYGPDWRLAVMMPLFHTAQLNGVVTAGILRGTTLVLLRGFEPGLLLETIERERISMFFCLPIMFRALLEHPDLPKRDLSSLRLAVYAMAPMPHGDLKRVIETLGCDVGLGFGQTEMSPLTTFFRPEHQLTHAGSVGTQMINVQTAVMDDQGNLLPPGESGEIVYRGPHAMESYLHDEEATAAAFAHGWFHSGDVGRFDEDGVLWFEDRTKDVIKTGGENVASIEVERALYDGEPRIQEVVVIGLPDERWGEAITAVVTPRPGETLTEDDVIEAAKRSLPGFKAPKRVIFVDELPRTSTGKVQKNVLREQYVGERVSR